MKYQWVLFDADETLFHFDAKAGLQHMFAQYDVVFTDNDFVEYKVINDKLWEGYQNGTVDVESLKTERFTKWSERLSIPARELNSQFLMSMAKICTPLAGVKSLLEMLSGKAKMAIITNGFTELQEVRLSNTGLTHYFSAIITSEQVGVAKPNERIFDYALSQMEHEERSSVLMVGDNVNSDILGANRAGFDSCWLNTREDPLPNNIKATYQVRSIPELEQQLLML